MHIAASGGVARLVLDRPERHNAFDDALVAELDTALERAAADPAVRAVVLSANGRSFCAGADLDWMRRTAALSRAENEADAVLLGRMLARLNTLPKPTVALVQGGAYGGGVGLVAACDIAIAAEDTSFALSEVRLGLIPAVICPYVIAAMGPRAARRLILTAERFEAAEAHRVGLVHMVVPGVELGEAGERVVAQLLRAGPEAAAAAKRLVDDIAGRPIDEALVSETARRIAATRSSHEAAEGIAAFLERRAPRWEPR
ncbi:MAG: enoyl-CoA hydratase/isomerase family protein [Alphaproteobacteria bacterium]|nr:enoyl-CoA hydratase/isomerase family protein [Alphaproteobacteria bacterium]